MNQKEIQHLAGRCGTCTYWSGVGLGQGDCNLVDQTDSPMRLSDGGGLYVRIDFGCRWYTMSDEAKAILDPPKEAESKKDRYGRII